MTICRLVEDKREISSVNDGNGGWWIVGLNDVTKIEAYDEPGQMSYVPWLAVFCGDTISTRMDAANKIIRYQ